MAVGVASPSAQGQAITSTDTEATNACGKYSDPNADHTTNVNMANAITVGTKTALMRSTSFCTGALEPCASLTERIMRDNSVSAPTLSALIVTEPSPLTVPDDTLSPFCFSTLAGSPVSMLSSTEVTPSSTRPSTGIRSPGRTRRRSPGTMCDIFTVSIFPSLPMRNASGGCMPIRARKAAPVLRRLLPSMSLPVSTKAMIMAAPS